MSSFRDSAGVEWKVEVNYAAAIRLNKEADFNIQSIFDKGAATEFFNDWFKIGSVLWILVEEQAAKIGISPEMFASRLGGDAFEDACLAVMEAIINFFPRDRRQALDAGLRKTREVEKRIMERTVERLNSGDLDQKIENILNGKSPAANSQESAA